MWIEAVSPEVEGGRFPAKRVVGDELVVEADLVSDGHDLVAGVVRYRHASGAAWKETPLEELVNDRYRGSFALDRLGRWSFTVEAWVDHFATWRRALSRKVEAAQDVAVDLLIGAELVAAASRRAGGAARKRLAALAAILVDPAGQPGERVDLALGEEVAELVARYPDRERASRYDRELEVVVDRERAAYSAWYELFPRSWGAEGAHGSLRDAEAALPYVASMGFDVIYLPPIHPIGSRHRKGRNNALAAAPEDPGSPWAIGNAEGGHKALHPQLGTLEDLARFRERAAAHGLELALDVALQASADHPYLAEHPEWFRRRPDGTIQYAENPPKKYQDIYPFDFESEAWRELWAEALSIFLFWCEQGVRIFRVDNPHTKALRFWDWCLREIKQRYPDAIFLAEAFTRPKLMYALAKRGFSQSYTYFTWRNTAYELREYLTHLTRDAAVEFFRPNLWPNTPDILPEHLQHGGRPAFIARLVLAATLSANYGVYGPAFELMEHVARPGSEEYIDNEKYELKRWPIDDAESLRELVALINRIRRDNPALQRNHGLCFHRTDNEQLLAYSKRSARGGNVVLVVVNLDPHHRHSGWIDLDVGALGMQADQSFQVHDLISGARYLWTGGRSFVELDPQVMPAHIFAVRRRLRSERDFDYFG